MNALTLFLGTLIAFACGFIFHLIRGGGMPRLLLYIATAWVGFFSGNLVGTWLNWKALRIGTINLFPALLATVLSLLISSFLAGPERVTVRRRRSKRKRPK